jgi:hypothetical protein
LTKTNDKKLYRQQKSIQAKHLIRLCFGRKV